MRPREPGPPATEPRATLILGRADVHALLDVQRLVGAEAMQRAVRAAVALRPPYGQPLPAVVQERFLEEVPAALRGAVQAKLAMVRS